MDGDDLKVIGAGGSPVIEIQVGRNYAIADRPGLYTVIQFESSEELTVREFGTGVLLIVRRDSLRSLTTPAQADRDDLKLLEDDERIAAAEKKLEAIKDLLPFRRVPKAKWEVLSAESGIKIKTLREWHRRYRKDPRLSSLMRKRRSDAGQTRLHVLVEKQLKARLDEVLGNGNLTLSAVFEDLKDDVRELQRRFPNDDKIVLPVFSTVYERYRELSEYDKDAAKIGARQAGLLHRLQKGSISDIDHPLAMVQVDHLELPVIVVDEVDRIAICKGWITVLIDIWSRCVVGYYITLESPGDLSLGMAISHAILPKTDTLKLLGYEATWPISGFMWAVHSDNAGEFHGNMLELAAKEYLFEIIFRKVKQPQYGAYIESYLGTLSGKLRRVPGATREGKDALGDYDPAEAAIMTLAELEQYVLNLIIEYHASPHTGLGGMAPMSMFKEGLKGGCGAIPIGRLRHATEPVKLMLDFLPVKERVISEKGVVIDYVWYMDDCLQRWVHARDPQNVGEARMFLFRRDPRDITRIYFWDPESREYKLVRTRNVTRPKMSLWEFTAIRKFLEARGAKDIDEDMIFRARDERRRLLAEAAAKTRKARKARERERYSRAEVGARALQNKVGVPHDTAPPESAPSVPPSTSSASMPPGLEQVATPFEMNWDD